MLPVLRWAPLRAKLRALMRRPSRWSKLATLGIVAGLTGCGTLPPDTSQFLRSEAVREPARGAGHAESLLTEPDGTTLYVQSWRPRAPRGVLVIVHGLRDHSGRYARLAKELLARGFAVYAPDLRGHGRSSGPRVTVDRFDQYLSDVDAALGYVRGREGSNVPLFLMGHSMGGAIVALHAERPTSHIDGLILSAPAIESYASRFERCGANMLADFSPMAPVFSLDMSKWSRVPAVRRDNEGDPLVYQRGAPIATGTMLLDASDEALAGAPFVHVPLLAMHGLGDRITNPAGSKAFVAASRSSDKTLKTYPKLYHDLWNEPERATLVADLVGWLSAHAPLEEVPGASEIEEPSP